MKMNNIKPNKNVEIQLKEFITKKIDEKNKKNKQKIV